MKQKQVPFPVTFEVQIEDSKNYTWQGKLITTDGRTIAFRSELELLLAIDELLCKDNKGNGRPKNQCH